MVRVGVPYQGSVAQSGSRQIRRGLWAATALPSGLLAASGFPGSGAVSPERARAPVIAGWGRRGRSGWASPQPASCAWCVVGCSRWLLVPHVERMRKHPFEGERSEPERLNGAILVGFWCRMVRGCASIRSRASEASPRVLFVCLVGVFVWLVVGLVGVFVWLVCWFGLVEWVFMMYYCLVGLHAATVSGLYPNCSRYTPHLNPLRGSKL